VRAVGYDVVVKEIFRMAAFIFSRVRTARSFSLFVRYFLLSIVRRITGIVPARKELFAETKDLDFFFSAGRSELSPYVEIYRDHTYEQDGAFIARPGDTVVDVGGHIGFYAAKQARRVGPEGRVFVFEPNPESFGRLLKNMEANGLRNVRTFNFAVTARAEQVMLRIAEGSSEATTIMKEGTTYAYDREIPIPAISLDRIARENGITRIDILKIDAEGAEVEIVESGESYALTLVRNAIVETHSEALKEEIKRRMGALGFVLKKEVSSGINALGVNAMLYFTR